MSFITDAASASGEEALASSVTAICPGFVSSGILHRSPTSVLLAGEVWGEPAVAKVLVSSSPFWRETFVREIDTYRYFERRRPPFAAPRLIAADDRPPVLVMERVNGEPLLDERYPKVEIAPRRLAALFTALRRVNSWQAPVGERPRMLDYRSRLDRYRRGGQLTSTEAAHLAALLTAVGDAGEFCHGDLVLSHVLRRVDDYKEGDYALVDWAFAGIFLPGFDLAKLWTVLRATFGVRSEIEDSVRGRGALAWNAFVVNLAVVLAQELRTHREAPSTPERDERLAGLQRDWLVVRDRMALAVEAL
jgi:hypothetical protein